VARFPVRRFVVGTYAFFVVNLLVLYAAWRAQWDPITVGRIFYVWTSVFNLFVVSVFWGVMADSFRSDQAKRLFGFIAVGGTLGTITGSAITAFLVQTVGVANLLVVSATLLSIATAIVAALPRPIGGVDAPSSALAKSHDKDIVGGSPLAGIAHVMRSPYLAGIAGFIFLYVFGSTALYVAQTDIMGKLFEDRELRTAMLGKLEFASSTITAIGQLLLTGPLMRRFGLRLTLTAVPLLSVVGFLALGAAGAGMLPLFATFAVLSVARRSTEFIMTNPSRKVLFTVLDREDKYKATSFIETFVYRGGDQLSILAFDAMIAAGLTIAGTSSVASGVSILFVALALWLAKRQHDLALRRQAAAPTPGVGQPEPVGARG
jgi:AAA family ATP:ADP antiporter